jgi:hypothetical protein
MRLVAGGMAGITSVICTYPLDLIRTRLSLPEAAGRYHGILDAAVKIVQEEGFRAMFKGILPTVAGIAPYVGLNFMTYETLKAELKKRLVDRQPNTIELLICGGIAGAVAQTSKNFSISQLISSHISFGCAKKKDADPGIWIASKFWFDMELHSSDLRKSRNCWIL